MNYIKSVSICAAFLGGFGATVYSGELTVTVSDIRTTTGTLQLSVSNSDDAWNNRAKPVAGEKVAVSGNDVVLRFSLPAGTYAVQVMHDANGNNKLDTNFMGIPVEGYGFSNNPTGLRKATFEEARFPIGDSPKAIVIRLR